MIFCQLHIIINDTDLHEDTDHVNGFSIIITNDLPRATLRTGLRAPHVVLAPVAATIQTDCQNAYSEQRGLVSNSDEEPVKKKIIQTHIFLISLRNPIIDFFIICWLIPLGQLDSSFKTRVKKKKIRVL